MSKRQRLLVPLVVLLAAVTLTVGAGNTASRHTTVLTGTIDLTYSLGQCTGGALGCWVCNQAVDLDLVRINVDSSAVSRDALKLMPGCTGRIGRIEIQTQSADGVKVGNNLNGDTTCTTPSNCVHDLAIQSGWASSTGVYVDPNTGNATHQDCVQFMGGMRIQFTSVVFSCATATNAQWFVTVNKAGTAPLTPPTDVVCDQCEFHPGQGHYHDVTIADSLRAGVTNSLVCPGSAHNLQFDVTANAQSPVDVNNAKPWPQGSDPRCWYTDTNPPVLTLPGAQVVEATSSAGAVVSYSASATDPEEGSIPIACNPASGSTFPFGQTTVACSASDKLGHTTTGSFTVTVGDTTAPTAPTSLNVGGATATTLDASWGASTDAVGVTGYGVYANGSLLTTSASPSLTLTGLACGTSYTITVDAFDAAGNRSAQSSGVTQRTSSCVVARFPTTDAVGEGTGTWLNPTNVQAADGLVATSLFPGSKGITHRMQGNFGFAVPANAIIDNVTLGVKWRVTSAAGITYLRIRANVGASQLAIHEDAAEPTTLTARAYDATADRAWQPADFADGTFQTRLSQAQGNSATAADGEYDYVQVTVTYHLP